MNNNEVENRKDKLIYGKNEFCLILFDSLFLS